MVVPCGIAAAQAASAAGSAGATVLGLSMGKTDLDLTRNLFKMQMRQAKRLWTADWADASVRHGEQCMQSAQQHSEAQALASAAYFQSEKIASQGFKLARDQDSRAYEMSWRAEVRESLRDELVNQNNRFNIIMLCDTVCLSCVFSLVAEGFLPEGTHVLMVNVYMFSLGVSISLFSISLWCSVIVVRRLHEHTASTLERKLFAQSDDLQRVWRHQLDRNLPTGPREMLLVNHAYEKWIGQYVDPIGKLSIHMLSIGVVGMFFTAGLLIHARYMIGFQAPTAVAIFWSNVLITSITVIYMKFDEDKKEKRKEDVYDNSWQDQNNFETGPFAKVNRAAKELFSDAAVGLASAERMDSFGTREKAEREFCTQTNSLHHRVESLRTQAKQRAKTRKDILQLLTTATEEQDPLPEELSSRLNKVLHDIDEADRRTANFITTQSESMLSLEARNSDWGRLRMPPRLAMAPHPIDAQRIPVSLTSLRKKLGEISLTTLLRLKNLSDEPLRLKGGVKLSDGKYIKSLRAVDPSNNPVSYHLYPVTEIPPRTEVIVVARSGGGWVPTSGIEGEIVYENRDESWIFRISFRNELLRNVRTCQVQASRLAGANDAPDGGNISEQFWQISREELDCKSNNEILVSIDVVRGEDAKKAAHDFHQSHMTLKAGFLLKNKPFGLRLQWNQRWFELTPTEIIYSQDIGTKQRSIIPIKDIIRVRPCADLVHENVFEIQVRTDVREPYKLAAESPWERDDWVQKISAVIGTESADFEANLFSEHSTSSSSARTFNDEIELVQSHNGIDVKALR